MKITTIGIWPDDEGLARADRFFTAEQQQRLHTLMARWRAARDAAVAIPAEEQAELDALVEDELRAAGERAQALLQGLAR